MRANARIERAALCAARDAAAERLAACRTADGHWTGTLSSSALSTATAVFALASADARAHAERIRRGLDWLAQHQNADGGWGDTVRSHSNLSATALGWSAFAADAPRTNADARAIAAAERYLAQQAGDLQPASLARAITARYGQDRTFSVPILTMCALAGRLGEGRDAWRRAPALPFELAACPHAALKALRLPVVSYALPALIAIGQAQHRHRPTRNPLARAVRGLTRAGTLRLLEAIQPLSGGFLEAAPLTSFVVMSLASIGLGRGPVARRGARFLRETARADGSWPIDTDLATWVTTQAVEALARAPAGGDALDAPARRAIRDWLLAQQHAAEHPYTHAAPGGWAWTDRSGGVPDADDTAGALLALRRLGPIDERTRAAAAAGCRWLLDLQNADGGVPTFCRGWGHLPFDRSCQDLTAHAVRAWSAWSGELPRGLRGRAAGAIRRGVDFLVRTQGRDGHWSPLWFGSQDAPGEENPTYGTARVLTALRGLGERHAARLAGPVRRGIDWLLAAQDAGGGWGGAPGVAPSIEETALATDALSRFAVPPPAGEPPVPIDAVRRSVGRGASWLIDRTDAGREFPAAPIGLYFATLWYFEELYPVIFTASALSRAAEALGA